MLVLYVGWKAYSWVYRPAERAFIVPLKDIDIYSGMRDSQLAVSGQGVSPEDRRASVASMAAERNQKKGPKHYVMRAVRTLI
jgi:amino acid transporter